MVFKKGQPSWKKGLTKETDIRIKSSWCKGLTKENNNSLKKISLSKLNEKNHMWKGDKVGKVSLHRWVERRKPKPLFCEICNKRKPYDLANISGEYKRDINDYKWKCRSCHMKEDGRINNLKKGPIMFKQEVYN
jgi:hypothetical protein